jgi:hypothetical protein
MLDNTRSKQLTQPRQSNKSEQNRLGRGHGRGNGRGGRGPGGRGNSGHGPGGQGNGGRGSSKSTRPFTTYTGPQMVMQPNMFFSQDDWKNKLTQEQRNKLSEIKRNKNQYSTPNSSYTLNITESSVPTQQTSSDVTPSSTLSPLPGNQIAQPNPGHNIRQLLSNAGGRQQFTCIHRYRISKQSLRSSGALIDGGANGGMSGADVRVISETLHTIDVTGLAEKTLSNLPVCTVAALIQTNKGPIIGIFHQYAHYGKGQTVHSSNQLKAFGIMVDDTPRHLPGGTQRLLTPEGYFIPISIRNGLPYIDMSPPTDEELSTYPHVIFTSDLPWNPDLIDNEYTIEDLDIHEDDIITSSYHPNTLNDYGEIYDHSADALGSPTMVIKTVSKPTFYLTRKQLVAPKQHDFVRLAPNFAFLPPMRIQKTFDNTTQFARLDTRLPLRKHFKSRFPAANISRLNEVVATDTFFYDIPALDDGIMGHGGTTMVQLFCGCSSLLTAVFPMKSESDMAGTLEDFIRHHGAPKALFSDNAKAQIGSAVQEILRMYAIRAFQCEPHHQQEAS